MASALAMGAVASAGLWALTDVSPAHAQTMQDVLPAPGARPAPEQRPESPPADASASEAPAPDLSTEAGRAARLDQLFADLPLVDDVQAEKMEAEIQRLWARSGSDTMDLILTRGRIALERDEVVKALHHFTAVTDHDPEFAEGWNMRATAFFIHGDLGMALSDIERVLALEPRHYGALSGLGVILEQIGREADALAAFREAQRVNPHLENVEEAIERLAHRVDGRDI
ncbi:tetratricopeptide repeat protein [Albimonas sp. CAU 1670]|uniref:tetratricopeptide repeat protein n=1 Tax=Albimonas sp. CAU 1670 TaxID=3032599 RepID=UPI0023DC0207|nr:tetratricopeptide repeat protein [Albimonas sp. CAU 1670]MDF2231654.1 tetratricopeptide repeat protein [Albimonas sp. CAU 1670]